jgi:hypothetical protein
MLNNATDQLYSELLMNCKSLNYGIFLHIPIESLLKKKCRFITWGGRISIYTYIVCVVVLRAY